MCVAIRNIGIIWIVQTSSLRESDTQLYAGTGKPVRRIRDSYVLINSINDSEDSFERMLAVLRFTFSKDLKFIVSAAHRLHAAICSNLPSTPSAGRSANPTTLFLASISGRIGM